jgi:hypothetical protein
MNPHNDVLIPNIRQNGIVGGVPLEFVQVAQLRGFNNLAINGSSSFQTHGKASQFLELKIPNMDIFGTITDVKDLFDGIKGNAPSFRSMGTVLKGR